MKLWPNSAGRMNASTTSAYVWFYCMRRGVVWPLAHLQRANLAGQVAIGRVSASLQYTVGF